MTAVIFTLIIGALGVLQSAINRHMSTDWGLANVIMLNNIVLLVFGTGLLLAVKFWPHAFPELFDGKASLSNMRWHYILPGIFGLIFVVGIPFAISRLGALDVFVVLVGAQMTTSLLWDKFVEGIDFSLPRLAGAGLAIAAAFVFRLS